MKGISGRSTATASFRRDELRRWLKGMLGNPGVMGEGSEVGRNWWAGGLAGGSIWREREDEPGRESAITSGLNEARAVEEDEDASWGGRW